MGYDNMMYYNTDAVHGAGAGDLIGMVIALVILADLILLGCWLWKQIQK